MTVLRPYARASGFVARDVSPRTFSIQPRKSLTNYHIEDRLFLPVSQICAELSRSLIQPALQPAGRP
jgi:hypothetical protein